MVDVGGSVGEREALSFLKVILLVYAAICLCYGLALLLIPGVLEFDSVCAELRTVLDPEGPFAPAWAKLVELGALEKETVLNAQKEIDAWHAHPHALHIEVSFLAGGRVP